MQSFGAYRIVVDAFGLGQEKIVARPTMYMVVAYDGLSSTNARVPAVHQGYCASTKSRRISSRGSGTTRMGCGVEIDRRPGVQSIEKKVIVLQLRGAIARHSLLI